MNLHTLAHHQMFMRGRQAGKVQGAAGSLWMILYGMLVKMDESIQKSKFGFGTIYSICFSR